MVSYLIFSTSYYKAENQSYRKLSSTIIQDETFNILQHSLNRRNATRAVKQVPPEVRDRNFYEHRISIARRDFHQFIFQPYVSIIIRNNVIFGPLVIKLVRYKLKQLFTSVSVKVVDVYVAAIHYSPALR